MPALLLSGRDAGTDPLGVVAADLKQASALVASFVYNAAQRPAKLPRKQLVED